jgi:hypothetical protein
MSGDALDAALVLEEAIAGLDAEAPEHAARLEADMLLLTQSALAARAHLAGRLARARSEVDRLDGPTAPVVQAVVAVDLAHTDAAAAAAAELAERVLAERELVQDSDVNVAFYLATVALALCERLSAARALLNAALERAQRRGSLSDFQSALCVRAWVLQRQGRLRDAESDARLALEPPRPPGADILRAWKLAAVADTLMERDGLDAAAELLSPESLGAYFTDTVL